MKIKVSEATPLQLNYLVAKCSGFDIYHNDILKGVVLEGFWVSGYFPGDLNSWIPLERFEPSINWQLGGPIIEREAHNLFKHNGGTEWCCACNVQRDGYVAIITADGPTPLIAAMRCFVSSKLGDEVEVPDELV